MDRNEPSFPPLEVDNFPHTKTSLHLYGFRLFKMYLLGENIHSSIEEAKILEQLYEDAQTS